MLTDNVALDIFPGTCNIVPKLTRNGVVWSVQVPLYGCGGASHVVIDDAKKPTERADYLVDIGEVSI